MKNKNIMLMAAMSLLSLFSSELFAQERNDMSKAEIAHADSLAAVSLKEEQVQQTNDANTIAEYKIDRNQTRAKARDAQRVENEANAAARESRSALRAEKKAQKARTDATRQAKKASKAREKSDKN